MECIFWNKDILSYLILQEINEEDEKDDIIKYNTQDIFIFIFFI